MNDATKAMKKSSDERLKEKYEAQAEEHSIAVAEIERLRANRKLISKGKKNRAKLLNNCKLLSVADLVVFVEKEKSKFLKLKRNVWRLKRLEEARKLNCLYASFGKMLQRQAVIDKPKCDRVMQETPVNNNTFTNTDEANSFWKRLWEEEGSENTEAEWIDTIREAMEGAVPEVPTDGLEFERRTSY